MDDLSATPVSVYETLVFLEYFKDFPDPRERGKVMYLLDEVLLLALLAVLGEPRPLLISPALAPRNFLFCAGFGFFYMAPPHTTIWATFSRA